MTDTITVRGFAGTAPEHRAPDSGTEVTTLRLGSTPRWRNSHTGEWSSGSTNWYTVAAFGRLAQNVAESISKGDPIVVVGRPKVRQWEKDDGIRGTDVEISAQSVAHDLTYGRTAFTKVSAAPRTDAPGPDHRQDGQAETSASSSEAGTAGSADGGQSAGQADESELSHHGSGAQPAGEPAAAQGSPEAAQPPAAEPQTPWSGDPALHRAG